MLDHGWKPLAGIALVATFITPPPVQAAPADHGAGAVINFCTSEILPETPEASLGECVAYNQTLMKSPDDGFLTQQCNAFLELSPEDFYAEYESLSECIRDRPGHH